MVHHGLLGLRLCISTIGISTTYCKEPNNYPPKRCMSATTNLLTQCSKSMHRWNPLCKGFILVTLTGILRGATLHSDTYNSEVTRNGYLRFEPVCCTVPSYPKQGMTEGDV
jgi:hypothetical protein